LTTDANGVEQQMPHGAIILMAAETYFKSNGASAGRTKSHMRYTLHEKWPSGADE
jgi:hypothetical protein